MFELTTTRLVAETRRAELAREAAAARRGAGSVIAPAISFSPIIAALFVAVLLA